MNGGKTITMNTAIVPAVYLEPEERLFKAIDFCKYYREVTPNWNQLALDDGSSLESLSKLRAACTWTNVLSFAKHYGRPSHLDYIYSWRALYFASVIFSYWEYDKVILMSDDLYILSRRMMEYIDSLPSGWTTFWCPAHSFPETSCQVIVRGCEQFETFVEDRNISKHNGKLMENVLPFTYVNKEMVGDRYGERSLRDQPTDIDSIDFWAQATNERRFTGADLH
jgi:hypothetical protein